MSFCNLHATLKNPTTTKTKNPTESSHQRRKERIERHKKLTLQQYDNNTKNLFINNINDLKNTLKNKNKIMKKYSTLSTSSNSSTCSSSSATDDPEHVTSPEKKDLSTHNQDLKEENEDDETHVQNETYTYEYVTTSPPINDKVKSPENVSEDEYVTECFEQTYSIIDILNDCDKSKSLKTVVPNETSTMRSSSSMSGLSSVGSSSSSSLSNNGTSSSSININSISPNTTQTTHVESYNEDSNDLQKPKSRTLNTEIYYPSSRTPYANSINKLRNLSPQPIVVVTPPQQLQQLPQPLPGMCFIYVLIN